MEERSTDEIRIDGFVIMGKKIPKARYLIEIMSKGGIQHPPLPQNVDGLGVGLRRPESAFPNHQIGPGQYKNRLSGRYHAKERRGSRDPLESVPGIPTEDRR